MLRPRMKEESPGVSLVTTPRIFSGVNDAKNRAPRKFETCASSKIVRISRKIDKNVKNREKLTKEKPENSEGIFPAREKYPLSQEIREANFFQPERRRGLKRFAQRRFL